MTRVMNMDTRVYILQNVINGRTVSCFYQLLRPFFFNYLVYGSADPIFKDFEKNKILNFFFFFFLIFFFTHFQLQVPSPDKGGGLASAAVQL